MMDILVELTVDELQELIQIYEAHKELPHLQSFLKSCLTATKKAEMQRYVSVFCLRNGSWKEDGTFIAEMPLHGTDFVVHSLDPEGKNLVNALKSSSRFKQIAGNSNSRDYVLFYAIHEYFAPKIRDILTKIHDNKLAFYHETYLWCLSKSKSWETQLKIDNNYYVKALEEIDVKTIVRFWPYAYPGAESKFCDWLKLGKGFGVYRKEDDQLISWVTNSALGQMSALQTLEEYKRKGFGSLVVSHMAQYLAEKGFDCCGTVYTENKASEMLLEKLGFQKMFRCYYIGFSN